VAAPLRTKLTAPTAAVEGVNFGDLSMYVAGGGLPDGDYCCMFTVQMYQAKKQDGSNAGPVRLGVMMDAYPLSDPKPESVRQQFYSMGSNADKSFAPNPATGKGLVPIAGAAGATLNHSTNWAVFLKSLYDSGLPVGVFTNDFTTIDGIWCHVQNIPEPEERKGFRQAQQAIGEGGGEQPQNKGTIAVVTEIKDDGKPWEGTGGLPDAPAVPALATAKAKVSPIAKAATKAPAKAAPAPAAVAEPDSEDVQTWAITGISEALEKSPNGCPRLLLRTQTFNAVKTKASEDMASAVIDTYFTADDALSGILGELGYKLAGVQIKPI
jgi:hypothetical protein